MSEFLFLLRKDNLFSVHDCNMQQPAMEMYKVVHGLVSKATSVPLSRNSDIQTCSQSGVLMSQVNTVYFGQNSVRYSAPIR